MYMHTVSIIKLEVLEKEKYTLHIIACPTVVTCAFCHVHVENLMKGPVFSHIQTYSKLYLTIAYRTVQYSKL